MPDSPISSLTSLLGSGLAPNDVFPLVDVSDVSMGAGGTNKKITRQELCTFDMGSITTSTPILNLAQTWNAGGVTFTALKLNVTDTASVSGSLLLDLQVGGSTKFNITKNGTVAAAGGFNASTNDFYNARHVKFVNGTYFQSSGDGQVGILNNAGTSLANLVVESNHTLAMRNGANFQEFRLYGSYTDGSNYDRLIFGPSGAAQFRISSDQAGTGTSRHLVFGTSNTDRFYINGSSGHLLAATDNSYDVGASGANRPRNLYTGGFIVAGGNVSVGDTLQFVAKINIRSPGDGVIALYNAAMTDFGRLQFGGTTNAFPAIKRVGTNLQMRAADDSGYVSIRSANIQFTNGSFIYDQSNTGVITLSNDAATDFNRLQFGGTTSSFPALKRSGAGIEVRLADDSGYSVMLAAAYYLGSNKSQITSPTDGSLLLRNFGGTDFSLLHFGGTTSAFPSLKRSSTSLLVRLADDSGFGFFNAYVDSTNTTAVNSVGYRGVPQNTQNADYTFALTDSGLHVFHDEVSARTYTIPTNASVSFNIGTTITIVNNTGAGNITLTSADTIRRGDGISGTGSRTIGPDSVVTLIKTKTTEWVITGAFF